MTALSFQTGGRHQKSPGLSSGEGRKKERKKERKTREKKKNQKEKEKKREKNKESCVLSCGGKSVISFIFLMGAGRGGGDVPQWLRRAGI